MLRCHWAAAQTWDSPHGSRWCSSSSAWVPYLVAVLLFVAGLVVLDFTVAILVLGVLLAVGQCHAMASAWGERGLLHLLCLRPRRTRAEFA